MTERRLPPNYRFKTSLGLHRKLTWKERFQILLGYCLTIDIQIAHLHNPGASASKVTIATTPNPPEDFDELRG